MALKYGPLSFHNQEPWVPHISLVFREMWDTTALLPLTFESTSELRVDVCGIPHLAKNERDVGHPINLL